MGRRRTNYIHADSETDPNNNNNISTAFLTAQRKSNVEHKKLHRLIAGSKRALLFFNIYSCLHSTLLLTLFASKPLVREENIAFDNDFVVAELKSLGKGKHS